MSLSDRFDEWMLKQPSKRLTGWFNTSTVLVIIQLILALVSLW
jgi:hypothetical protein